MTAYRHYDSRFMTHVTRRLTAKNRDQLRNPTLGNGVWATFMFYVFNAITSKSVLLTSLRRVVRSRIVSS